MPMPKILAVDDDEALLVLVEAVLKREGYRVRVACDGAGALEIVDNEHPDVIILDLMMPSVDGFAVLQRLKRRVKLPYVVCLTAKDTAMDREKAWRLGIDEYLTKPFEIESLVTVVGAVLGRSWSDRRRRRHLAINELHPA
jgi:DNA-binding response OmpR family regulator